MKKMLFTGLTIFVGIICYISTFASALLEKADDRNLFEVCFWSYVGVIFPVLSLEIAKLMCFKNKSKKLYFFDIIGIAISLSALGILNFLICGGIDYWRVLREEFFLFHLPWIIALLCQVTASLYKTRR